MFKYKVYSSDKSSTYTVTIRGSAGSVRIKCTCAAGENGQHCKHRVSLLEGDVSSVCDGDVALLSQVKDWMIGSALEAALRDRLNAEMELDVAKKKVKLASKKLAVAMLNG